MTIDATDATGDSEGAACFTLTEQDMVAASKLHALHRFRRIATMLASTAFVLAVILALLMYGDVKIRTAGADWTYATTIAVGILFAITTNYLFLIIINYFIGAPRFARKNFRENKEPQQSTTLMWSSEGLSHHREHSDVTIPWECFLGWREDEDVLILYESRYLFLTIPRRALTKAQEASLRSYLAQIPSSKSEDSGDSSARRPGCMSHRQRNMGGASPVNRFDAVGDADNTIHFTLNEQDVIAAYKLSAFHDVRRTMITMVPVYIAISFLCSFGLSVFLNTDVASVSEIDWGEIFIWFIVIASILVGGFSFIVVVVVYFINTPRKARRTFREQKTLRSGATFSWSPEGLSVRTELGDTTTPWKNYLYWCEDDAVIILYASQLMIQSIPRRALTAAQEACLRKHLAQIPSR